MMRLPLNSRNRLCTEVFLLLKTNCVGQCLEFESRPTTGKTTGKTTVSDSSQQKRPIMMLKNRGDAELNELHRFIPADQNNTSFF